MKTTTEATLMVASSYTKCSACDEGTDPAAETHVTATGYGMQYPADGCGARFTAISSNTTVSRPEVRDAIRGILRAMRPDLPIVDAYEGQGIASPADPAAAAEVVRSWLVGTDDHDLVEFEAPVLRALLAERDQLAGERGRYRTAWRVARTRARSAGASADMYAKRSHDLHEALMDAIGGQFLDLIAALTAPACETDDYGNCATHGVLALEPGAQCPHVIARALLELIQWPTTQPDGSR